ncbi:MAG: radical SAM family heme chaperone HemW [bacterium]|nr:radical SAM family heme chaperone HemW [bacterium]
MGIYIHIPFCGSICSYCHFSRTADHQPVVRSRYVDAVISEFEFRQKSCNLLNGSQVFGTTYIGGGTPSELEPALMEKLIAGTVGQLKLAHDFEFTAEANPESFSDETAIAWKKAGINRISMGVQSLDEGVLQLLGRQCPPAKARTALKLACNTFERVSADWIIGPGLKLDSLLAELDEALNMGVEHFSLYILELHEGTRLQKKVIRGEVDLLADEQTELLYLAVVDYLAGKGIEQYEVSNFSLPGAESRHNGNYWLRKPWLGLGAAAHGCFGRNRFANIADPFEYMSTVEAGQLPVESLDELVLPSRLLERLILGLRTRQGIPVSWLAENCLDLHQGLESGLWTLPADRLVLTARGFLVIDSIEEIVRPACR